MSSRPKHAAGIQPWLYCNPHSYFPLFGDKLMHFKIPIWILFLISQNGRFVDDDNENKGGSFQYKE